MRPVVWALVGVGVSAATVARAEAQGVVVEHTFRQWQADPKKDPKHAGLVWIERRLNVDNARLWIKSVVDPAKDHRPVIRGYGDFFFGLHFGGFGNGGWNKWDFLHVASGYGKAKGTDITHTQRHLGAYVLERRARGVVEFAWRMPPVPKKTTPPGEMLVRLVKSHAEPQWLYLRVSVDPAHQARLQRVSVSAYPGQTSGPGVRRRVTTTFTRSHAMPNGAMRLKLPTEYAVSLHNKNAHEYDACLLVLDPDEIAGASVAGTYGVGAALTPKPGRHTVHLALGYFRKTHYPKGNAAFFASAPARLKRLRAVRWQADVLGAYNWSAYRATVARLMKHRLVRDKFTAHVKAVETRFEQMRADLNARGLTPTARAALERQFPALADQAKGLLEKMYPVAIEDLVGSE